jgi:hypothetical protein
VTSKALMLNSELNIQPPPNKKDSISQIKDDLQHFGLDGTELKVLLVEDNEINLKVCQFSSLPLSTSYG